VIRYAIPPPGGSIAAMRFRIGHVTDSHLYGRRRPGDPVFIADKSAAYRRLLGEVAAHGIELLVHTGDFNTFGADVEQYRHVRSLLDTFTADTGIPVLRIRGNHDSTLPDEDWERIMGPGRFIHEHRGWAFIGLDRYAAGYEHTPRYWDMNPGQIDWLEAALERVPTGRPAVLLLHENPVGITRFHRGEVLLHTLSRHNLRAILFGHVQTNTVSRIGGVPTYTVVGEARGFTSAPLSYAVATCHDDGGFDYAIHPYRTGAPTPAAAAEPTPATIPTGDAWREQRGPGGRRTIDRPLPAAPPSSGWRAALAGPHGVGGPAIDSGLVVVGTMSAGGFDECGVEAFDAATGERRWRTPVDGGVEGGVLIDDGGVYLGTTCGSVVALDLATGERRWRWNNRENLPITAQPVIAEGLLHVGANWECYALDAATGRLVWRRLCTESAGMSYFSGGHAAALVVGGRVVHQRPWNPPPHPQLQVMDAADGGGLVHGGKAAALFPGDRHGAAVLLDDGRLVTGSYGLAVYRSAEDVQDVAVVGGGASAATPAIGPGHDVAYLSHYLSIDAYDLAGVERRWSVPHEPASLYFGDNPRAWWDREATPIGHFSAPLAFADGVLVADSGGRLRALAADDGRERWRIDLGSPVLSALTWSGGAVYLATYDGTLWALACA